MDKKEEANASFKNTLLNIRYLRARADSNSPTRQLQASEDNINQLSIILLKKENRNKTGEESVTISTVDITAKEKEDILNKVFSNANSNINHAIAILERIIKDKKCFVKNFQDILKKFHAEGITTIIFSDNKNNLHKVNTSNLTIDESNITVEHIALVADGWVSVGSPKLRPFSKSFKEEKVKEKIDTITRSSSMGDTPQDQSPLVLGPPSRKGNKSHLEDPKEGPSNSNKPSRSPSPATSERPSDLQIEAGMSPR